MGKHALLVGISVCVIAAAVLFLTRGSPNLIGNQNAGSLSGLAVRPGQSADSVGWLVNRSGQTVTLVSAKVLPLEGFRTPRLVGVAVEAWNTDLPGFRGTGPTGGAVAGWPPTRMARTVPFTHYRLGSGGSLWHHTALIVFGVRSHSVGTFGVAGVTVTVRVGHDLVKVQSIGPLLFCVTTKQLPVSCPNQAQQQRALEVANTFE
jgi:hypothetical protein